MSEKNNEKTTGTEPNVITLKMGSTFVKRIILIITFALVVYWGLTRFDIVKSIVHKLLSVLSPFIIGFCIAFIINVLLRPIESLWDRLAKKVQANWLPKLKRPICLLLSTLLVIGLISGLIFTVIPEFTSSLTVFINMLPANITRTQAWIDSLTQWFESHGMPPMFELDLVELGNTIKAYITAYGHNVVNKTVSVTTSIFSGVFNSVLAFVLSIYMLAQKETLCRQVKKVVVAALPEDKAKKVLHTVAFTNKTFTNFVTGQLTEAVILGVLCLIGMLILRIPYASIVSVLVGFTALIPVFGAFIGTAIGAFLILLIAPMKALWFVIFILILQQIEGNLIYPKVVGKSVGLPGIWVLSAVTIGAGFFGFFGMLICVPVCSILYSFLREYVNKEVKKKTIEL